VPQRADDASGEDVSIGATWRSTMMANSARDPYWQAGVRRETMDHPMQADAIQAECAACHMPMLQKVSKAAGRKTDVFAQLPINKKDDSELHKLAADGVSCTVCHQISNEGLARATTSTRTSRCGRRPPTAIA